MKNNVFALLLPLLLCTICANAQHTDDAQKKRILENRDFFLSHNILLGDYTYDNPDLNIALHSALKYREKKRANAIAGGCLLAGGALGIVLGGLFKSNSKRNPSAIGGSLEGVMGDIFIGTGAVTAAISIPFFIASGVRQQDMLNTLDLARELRKQ